MSQNNEVSRIVIDVSHSIPTYLRFIVGGDDLKEYPGFNGQFNRVMLKIGANSFVSTEEDL